MQRTLTIQVGVVLAREKIDHPWQDHAWRPIEVFLNAPKLSEWRELRKGDGFVHYHAATVTVELHAKETPGYCENLDGPDPSLYVILREDDDETSEWPYEVHLVTASPHEVEAYGEDGSEIIAGVPMPEKVFDLLSAFVAEYHVEDPFIKRKRRKYHVKEEHKFGQEPLGELRRRSKPDDPGDNASVNTKPRDGKQRGPSDG